MLTIPIPSSSGFHRFSPLSPIDSVASPVGMSPSSKNTRTMKRLSKTINSPFARIPVVKPEVPEKPFHERVFEALKKINRTEDEARLILPIIKDFTFFKTFADEDDMEPDAMLYICQNLRYEYYPENTVIFVQGDGSNGKGYLIFSGEVSVVQGSDDQINKMKKKQESPIKEQTPKGKVFGRGFIKSGTRDFNKSTGTTPKSATKISLDFSHLHPGLQNHNNQPHHHSQFHDPPPIVIVTQDQSRDKSNDTFSNRLQIPSLSNQNSPKNSTNNTNNNNPDRNKVRRRSIRPMMDRRQSTVESDRDSSRSSRSRRGSTFLEQAHSKDATSQGGTFLALAFAGKLNIRRKSRMMDLPALIGCYGTLTNTLSKGSFFGELALINNTTRGATIITNTPCEFLIMTKEIFDYIKYTFNKNKRKILTFMQAHIPKIDTVTSPKVMENLYYLVEEQLYSVGNYITKEGDTSEIFYLLFEGECELSKAIYTDQSNGFKVNLNEISPLVRVGRMTKEPIPFTRILPGTFFGEEILYKKHGKYQFSVQVKSNRALVLVFKKNGFTMRFPRACLNALREGLSFKNVAHAARIRDLLKLKYPKAIIEDNFAIDYNIVDEEESEVIQEKVELKLKEVNPKTYRDNFRKTTKDTHYVFKFEDKEKHINLPDEKPVLPEISQEYVSPRKLDIIPKTTKRLEELKEMFMPLSRAEIYNKQFKNPFLLTKTSFESPKKEHSKIMEVTESPIPDKRSTSPRTRPPPLQSPERIFSARDSPMLSRSPSLQTNSPTSRGGNSPIKLPSKENNSIKPEYVPLKYSSFKTAKSSSVAQISEVKFSLTKIESSDSLNPKANKSPPRHGRTQSLATILVSPKERNIQIKPFKPPKQEIIRHEGANTKGTWGTFYTTVKKSPTYSYLRPPKTDIYDIESTKLRFQEESDAEVRQRAARLKFQANATTTPSKTFYSPRNLSTGATLINWMKSLDPPMMNDPVGNLASFRTPEPTLTDVNVFSPKNGSIYDYTEVADLAKMNIVKHDTANNTSNLPKLSLNQMFKDLSKPRRVSMHSKMLQQKHKTLEKLKKKTQITAPSSPSGEFSLKPSTSFPITRSSSIAEDFK